MSERVTKSVFEQTQIRPKIEECLQRKCQALKNDALMKRFQSGDPAGKDPSSSEWLQASLPKVDVVHAAIQTNLCVKECRRPLDYTQKLLELNLTMAKNNFIMCRQKCKKEFELLGEKSAEQKVESELEFEKCNNQCKTSAVEVLDLFEAKMIGEVNQYLEIV